MGIARFLNVKKYMSGTYFFYKMKLQIKSQKPPDTNEIWGKDQK